MTLEEFNAFQHLMDGITDKSGCQVDFGDFKLPERKFLIQKVSEHLKNTADPIPSLSTFRDYVYLYIGHYHYEERQPRVDYLDSLSKYLEDCGWKTFKKRFTEISLKQTATTKIQRRVKIGYWKKLIEEVSIYYQKQSDFKQIKLIGDFGKTFPELPMSEFYHDLSYVEFKELRKASTLLIKEKEDLALKTRSELFKVSGQVSHQLLKKHDRLVILGNPGSGKSLFSRNLCFDWSQNTRQHDEVLLHITLRRLDFMIGNNSLTTFIEREYALEEAVMKKLKEKNESVVLLLDGYDEINDHHKKKLWEDLNQDFPSSKFILFTRPYGLLNHHVQCDSCLEILGFNEVSRSKYIHNMLGQIQSNKIDALYEVFKNNFLVNALSYNPLSLSYMVIISESPEGVDRLNNIQSVYDLHIELVRWLKDLYDSKLKVGKPDFNKLLDASQKLALDMELNQQYLLESSDFDSGQESMTQLLSESGLARKERLEQKGWRFYFNTTSFQEFLAARAVADTITREAFEYTLSNQLYWNFSRMTIGSLNKVSRSSLVTDILNSLRNRYQGTNSEYFYYHYFSILAESNSKIVEEHVDEEFIKILFEHLAHNYDFRIWSSLFLESTKRLYLKMGQITRALFLKQLAYFITHMDKRGLQIEKLTITDSIVKDLNLNNNHIFLEALFTESTKLCKQFESIMITDTPLEDEGYKPEPRFNSEEGLMSYIGEIESTFERILDHLESVPVEVLFAYSEPITELLENLGEPHNIGFRLQVAQNAIDTLLPELEQQLNQGLSDQKGLFKSEDLVYDAYGAVQSLTHQVAQVCMLARELDYQDVPRLSKLIDQAMNMAKKWKNYELAFEETEHLGFIFVAEAMENLASPAHIEPYLELMREISDRYSINIPGVWKTQIIELTRQCLLQFLKTPIKSIKKDNLILISAINDEFPNVFHDHIDDFIRGIEHLIDHHWRALEKISNEYSVNENSNPDSPLIKALDLTIQFQIHAQDKHAITRHFVDSSHFKNPYFKYYWLPRFMNTYRTFPITSPRMWNYLTDLSEDGHAESAIQILYGHHRTLEYGSNYAHLDKLLLSLASNYHGPNYNERSNKIGIEPHVLIRILYDICKYLILSGSVEKNHKVLNALLVLMSKPWLKSFYRMYDAKTAPVMPLECLLVPLLLMELTGTSRLVEVLKLEKLYNHMRTTSGILLELLSVIPINKLELYAPLNQTKLFIECRKYHLDNMYFFKDFEKAEFERLLSV